MQDKAYILPYKASEKPSFWRGVLSAFNFAPQVERHSAGDPYLEDSLAMAGDWMAVGLDLENALAKARSVYGHKLEARGINAEITSESKPER